MKSLVCVFAALFLCYGNVAAADQHQISEYSPLNGELPWPFGTEIPFPWQDIDGIWMGEEVDGEALTFFSLRVRGQTRDERTLEVLEIYFDSQSKAFKVLSRGQGLESQRIVRGQMVGGNSTGSYRFSIRAYDVDQYGQRKQGEEDDIARVLTVAPVDPTDPNSLSFVLTRISDEPLKDEDDGEGQCSLRK